MSSKAGIQAAFLGKLGDFNIDLAFDAPMRGVTALFGPSGSGKTTALRCIAGLTKIGGALSVEGDIWQDSSTFVAPTRTVSSTSPTRWSVAAFSLTWPR